ncbi:MULTISPECIES: SWIM zinc finger family protein [unclassified Streptomyces]|uniref:SWIM zinc finger family protein n=1 Tax=unclassified Streptomyces TaxID=2593676 RepID=UPI002E17B3EE|nr:MULTISPECIES: SWF or SNF family helicase [unclassified Streptomyces]
MTDRHEYDDDLFDTEGDSEGADASDEERVFAALAPVQGRGFAQSWWGQTWLKALEDTALDLQQLKAGRRLARAGSVGAVSVRPGRVTAVVGDRGGAVHRADVLLQQLSEEEWDRFLGMAVERAGHIAALLDREMPPHLVEDAAAAGVELLPGIGDLEPRCGCDAWDHCAHTAALCYQLARLLDQDPFVLLLMRGRGERVLLDELQVRSVASASAGSADEEADEEPVDADGVDATETFAAGSILPPLPAAPPVPSEAGPVPSLDTDTEPPTGTDVAALEFLAARAAAEAHRMLTDALTAGHELRAPTDELTIHQDAVRLAAGAPEAWIGARLAEGSGRDGEGLAAAVPAWEHGGTAGLSVLEDEWTPDAETAARARTAVEAAWDAGERPPLSANRNRWTAADTGTQIRLGRDGRWWPFRENRGRWLPAGPAAHDPAAALSAAAGDE